MYYPINYGYIEGVMAPDGEEQYAYILGVNEPVKKFTGKIIAIVYINHKVIFDYLFKSSYMPV